MIVVTGCEGFIGKNLMNCFDNVMGFDITDFNTVFDINPKLIDRVYHMGALSSTTETDFNKIHYYNVDYSIRLFEWCIEHGIPVSYASSASVYGNTNNHTINPLNYYALSKATVDMWVKINRDRFSNIRGYRFYNVYGQGEEHKGNQASPVQQFTKQALETGKIKIFDKSGNGTRDFIWVGDVCRIMIDDDRDSGIYDVGTGKPISFSDVAKLVADKYGASIEVIPFPDHLKNKYQFYTCAKYEHVDETCISVEDYLLRLND